MGEGGAHNYLFLYFVYVFLTEFFDFLFTLGVGVGDPIFHHSLKELPN